MAYLKPNYENIERNHKKLHRYLLTIIDQKFFDYNQTYEIDPQRKTIRYAHKHPNQIHTYMAPFIKQYNRWFNASVSQRINENYYIIHLRKR